MGLTLDTPPCMNPGQATNFTWTYSGGVFSTDTCELKVYERDCTYYRLSLANPSSTCYSPCFTLASDVTAGAAGYSWAVPADVHTTCRDGLGDLGEFVAHMRCSCLDETGAAQWCVSSSADVCINGTDTSLALADPVEAGTTEYAPGQTVTFRWNTTGFASNDTCTLDIWETDTSYLASRLAIATPSSSYATRCYTVTAGTPNSGSFDWTLPSSVHRDCRDGVGNPGEFALRISCTCASELCLTTTRYDAHAFLMPASVTITEPNEASSFYVPGQTLHFQWFTSGLIDGADCDIDVYNNYCAGLPCSSEGQLCFPIVSGVPNTGCYGWGIPADVHNSCNDNRPGGTFDPAEFYVRVQCRDGMYHQDVVDRYAFDIAGGFIPIPTLTVLRPDSGDTWIPGNTFNITWSSEHIAANETCLLELWNENSNSKCHDIVDGITNTGSYSAWALPLRIYECRIPALDATRRCLASSVKLCIF